MTLSGENKKEIVKNASGDEKNSGSSESQIAIFTKRIEYLTEHLKNNKKDHSSRRGLLLLVSKRRKLLKYFKRTQLGAYKELIEKLNIRK